MESKIADIVSGFINVPVAQIGVSTPIDRSIVKSSIMLHRMYARLAEEGVVVSNYMEVRSFGDLLKRVGSSPVGISTINSAYIIPDDLRSQNENDNNQSGIDIEEIAMLPKADDFREASFYQMNFSASEISWCIQRPDPYASFAGLFAAKEALVKATSNFQGVPFNKIVIDHDPSGKPIFPGFSISISHSNAYAIAIAIARSNAIQVEPQVSSPTQSGTKLPLWIAILALCIAIASVLI